MNGTSRAPAKRTFTGNVASSMPSVRPHRSRVWLWGLFLAVSIIGVYQPVWNAGFIWDDDVYITNNQLLTAPDGLKRIWFSLDSPSQYFPLVYTSFRVERALWGLNAAGYHWINILLHAANALLLWRLLRRLGIPGAWLAAAIFALHPVQVETVAWVTERKNLLMLFFSLLTLRCWVEFTSTETVRRSAFYLLALFFYALALFSKTTACTIPAALLLILWLKKERITWPRILQVVPFFAMGIVMGLVTMWWERYHIGTRGEIFSLGPGERVLIASRAIWFYLGKLLWPFGLSFSYPRWEIQANASLSYGWLVFAVAAAILIFFSRRFAGRSVEVAGMFYVAMLSPMLGIIMLYTFRYTFVADHYQYFASVGPIALIAAAATGYTPRCQQQLQVAAKVAGIFLLAGLSVLTFRHSRAFKDPETLWNATLVASPNSLLALNNLGNILLDRGQNDAAMALFQRALVSDPNNPEPRNNLGLALFRKGKMDQAIAQYEAALKLNSHFAETHYNLGSALLEKKQIADAERHFRQAIEYQPHFAAALNDLANCCLSNGRLDEAIANFQAAMKADPASAQAAYNLGNALMSRGDRSGAVSCYETALKIDPNLAEAHNNLGLRLMEMNQVDEALVHFETAIKLQSKDAVAHGNLGGALLKKGRVDEAIAQFQEALRIEPDYVEVGYRLGSTLAQTGRASEAVACYQKILEVRPTDAEANDNLAVMLCISGRSREGIVHFEAALASNPNHVATLKNFAWLLATSPDSEVRNGARALELAQRAVTLSNGQNIPVLATLAAAQAELGNYDKAVESGEAALVMAGKQSNVQLANSIGLQLQKYRQHLPFRDFSY